MSKVDTILEQNTADEALATLESLVKAIDPKDEKADPANILQTAAGMFRKDFEQITMAFNGLKVAPADAKSLQNDFHAVMTRIEMLAKKILSK